MFTFEQQDQPQEWETAMLHIYVHIISPVSGLKV